MKTKSLLFAALVSISFATTSCQKEENITPNIGYYSNNTTPNTTTVVEEKEAIVDENIFSPSTQHNENLAKPTPNQPKATTPPTNIMQIGSDDIK